MADDESAPMDRLWDRIGRLERTAERLDERMLAKLGKDDATTLMDFATNGDGKLREDFLGRLGEFRIEVRDAFRHNERETASAIYKAVTEAEGRVTTAITALTQTIAAMNQQPPERRGLPPIVTYGGGGASLATIAAIMLYLATNGRIGIGG